MRDVARLGTVMSFIAIIGVMGGYEHGMFGLAGMFRRVAIFSVLMGVCVVADEVMTQRKRAKRVAARKAQKTKNKYEVICHK